MSKITRGCAVRVVSYPGDAHIGFKGLVVSINRLNGDSGPAELFLLREGGSELVEEDYLAVNEDEVEIIYTADQMERMRQEAAKRDRWSRGEFTEEELRYLRSISGRQL